MTEQEIRRIIRDVCSDLDRRVWDPVRGTFRKVVVPTMLGTGMALTACGSQGHRGGGGQAIVDSGTAQDSGGGDTDAGAMPEYMAPDDAGGAEDAGEPDAGPEPLYMAPDDAGPAPEYMAPDAGPQPDDAGPQPDDAGPQPEYMAPDDAGPMPPYMAPDEDAGPQPMYMPPHHP